MVDGQLVMQGQRFLLRPVRQENILDLCFHFSAVKKIAIAGSVCSKRQVRKEERRGWVRPCAGCKRRHWEWGWLALQALRGTIMYFRVQQKVLNVALLALRNSNNNNITAMETSYSIAVICTLMYTRKYRRVYTSPVLRSATIGSSWCRWRSQDPTLPCTIQRLPYVFAFYYLPLFTSRKPPFFASNSPSYSLPSDRMWRQVTVVKQEPIQSPPEYPGQ